MTPEEKIDLIESFYNSFKAMNPDAMVQAYHDKIAFKDPAFGVLMGKDAKDMWKMLCNRSADLRIEFSDIRADEETASARWEAWYTFSKNGRKIHNIIDAKFKFQDNLIIWHQDNFDIHSWASQAFGFMGKLIGGSEYFQKGLQKKTLKMLKRFQEKEELIKIKS